MMSNKTNLVNEYMDSLVDVLQSLPSKDYYCRERMYTYYEVDPDNYERMFNLINELKELINE